MCITVQYTSQLHSLYQITLFMADDLDSARMNAIELCTGLAVMYPFLWAWNGICRVDIFKLLSVPYPFPTNLDHIHTPSYSRYNNII